MLIPGVRRDPLELLLPTLLGEAVRSAPHAVFVSEEGSGRVLAANDAACALLGYELDEILGNSARTWSAAEPDVVAHVYAELSRPPANVRSTARLRRKDGAIVEIGYWASTTEVSGLDFLLTITDPVDRAVAVEPDG
jgi:PAS domain S-box-containing protein